MLGIQNFFRPGSQASEAIKQLEKAINDLKMGFLGQPEENADVILEEHLEVTPKELKMGSLEELNVTANLEEEENEVLVENVVLLKDGVDYDKIDMLNPYVMTAQRLGTLMEEDQESWAQLKGEVAEAFGELVFAFFFFCHFWPKTFVKTKKKRAFLFSRVFFFLKAKQNAGSCSFFQFPKKRPFIRESFSGASLTGF